MNRFSPWLICAVFFASSLAAQQAPARARPATHGPASTDSAYRNAQFGFSYKAPFGWVDRTEQMERSELPGESAEKNARDELTANGERVLLAMFERPPEAAGSTVNSAVLVVAENASDYPQLKTAADYFGPLTELATGKGFKAVGDAEDVSLDGRTLVRGDFSRELGALTMYQTSLVILAKARFVSFTFLGGSKDEVEELIDKLSFAVTKR